MGIQDLIEPNDLVGLTATVALAGITAYPCSGVAQVQLPFGVELTCTGNVRLSVMSTPNFALIEVRVPLGVKFKEKDIPSGNYYVAVPPLTIRR